MSAVGGVEAPPISPTVFYSPYISSDRFFSIFLHDHVLHPRPSLVFFIPFLQFFRLCFSFFFTPSVIPSLGFFFHFFHAVSIVLCYFPREQSMHLVLFVFSREQVFCLFFHRNRFCKYPKSCSAIKIIFPPLCFLYRRQCILQAMNMNQ